ncbi:MAG TPA: MJ0042-type zinc finger domain-containing protein, partial [Steroidobacteraceae bacterium]
MVTAADLRVAQGYVRCGRCSSVFNALARLSDERQAAGGADQPAALSAQEPEEPAQPAATDLSPLDQALTRVDDDDATETSGATEEPISEAALEFNPETTDVGAVFVEPPPNPQWTAATGSFKAMRAASQAESGDPQVDVEIDAAFLADMLREAAPQSDPSPQPEQPPPPAPDVPPAASAASPVGPATPARTVKPAAPPALDPSAEEHAPPDPPSGVGPAPAAEESAREAARHVSVRTRPPAEASVRRRATMTREPAPR